MDSIGMLAWRVLGRAASKRRKEPRAEAQGQVSAGDTQGKCAPNVGTIADLVAGEPAIGKGAEPLVLRRLGAS